MRGFWLLYYRPRWAFGSTVSRWFRVQHDKQLIRPPALMHISLNLPEFIYSQTCENDSPP